MRGVATAIATHDIHAALTLCIKLDGFWQTHGSYWREGITLARSALAMPDKGNGRLRIDALESVASLAWQHHQLDPALEFAEQALTPARSRGHPEELALVSSEQGDYARCKTGIRRECRACCQVPHPFNPGCPLAQLGEVALASLSWWQSRPIWRKQ
ncbi:MAG: hypothetical protein R2932_11560 [Caldilineaceae bacterium]